jgi:two-component sensor histidine kinase
METLANQVSVALENARLVQSLEQELGEKEVLLREIHHRVKNNLEVILSLADMQSRRVDDLRAKECLRVLQERIRTIALVHESLYRSPSLAHIQTQRYLQQLTDNLYTAFGAAGINLIVQSEDIEMGIDTAMPCGLIVTELVTNAFKYAFPADQANGTRGTSEISKEIKVTLKQVNSQIELQVSDNGIGMAEDLNWQNSKSLGLRLVTNLAGQLHGLLDVEIQKGTRFRLTFPRPLRGSPDG